jgi:DNA-binding protein H-NS
MSRCRKERNRMHAKLTRDRKKLFTAKISETISELEAHNKLMRDKLINIQTAPTNQLPSPKDIASSYLYSRDNSPREIWTEINHDYLQSV